MAYCKPLSYQVIPKASMMRYLGGNLSRFRAEKDKIAMTKISLTNSFLLNTRKWTCLFAKRIFDPPG